MQGKRLIHETEQGSCGALFVGFVGCFDWLVLLAFFGGGGVWFWFLFFSMTQPTGILILTTVMTDITGYLHLKTVPHNINHSCLSIKG